MYDGTVPVQCRWSQGLCRWAACVWVCGCVRVCTREGAAPGRALALQHVRQWPGQGQLVGAVAGTGRRKAIFALLVSVPCPCRTAGVRQAVQHGPAAGGAPQQLRPPPPQGERWSYVAAGGTQQLQYASTRGTGGGLRLAVRACVARMLAALALTWESFDVAAHACCTHGTWHGGVPREAPAWAPCAHVACTLLLLTRPPACRLCRAAAPGHQHAAFQPPHSPRTHPPPRPEWPVNDAVLCRDVQCSALLRCAASGRGQGNECPPPPPPPRLIHLLGCAALCATPGRGEADSVLPSPRPPPHTRAPPRIACLQLNAVSCRAAPCCAMLCCAVLCAPQRLAEAKSMMVERGREDRQRREQKVASKEVERLNRQ